MHAFSGKILFSLSVLTLSVPAVPVKAFSSTQASPASLQKEDSLAYGEQHLQDVTVIAKSKARLLQEQAYAVSVVDLKNQYTQVTPLNKVLNAITSVRLREDGGVGSNYSFAMNGFSGNQVKFFLDGIPMDNFGSSFNLANLSANMADRVEVYKGVLPVSLGADALGGAVNIVSRRNANYLDATYSIGSFNTHKVSVNGAYTNMKTGFTLRSNLFFNYSKNDYKVYAPIVDLNTGLQEGDAWMKRFNDQYHSVGLKLESGVVGRSWADYLLFGVIASENRKHIQTGATMDAVYGKVHSQSYSFIPSLRYKKTNFLTPGLDLLLYATYNMVNTDNVDTAQVKYNWRGESVRSNSRGEGYLTDALIRERQWQANANVNYVIDNHQSLTLNHILTSMHRKADDKEYPDYALNGVPQILTKNITGLGYQIRYDRWDANIFGKMYFLHTSTHRLLDQFLETQRYERVSEDKHQAGYGAALTYHLLPSLQMKASFEQAYRMPEANEIFGDGFIQKSNPSLKPEKSRNVNVGLLYAERFGKHQVNAEVNYIYRHTTDFILKGVSLTSDPTTAYDNIGKAITNGVEASVNYDFNNRLHVGGNITYQDIKDRERNVETTQSYVDQGATENVSYGQRMPNIPYFFFNANAGYNFRNAFHRGNTLSLEYDGDYVYKYYLTFPGLGRPTSKKYIPTQFSHNASVSYVMGGGRYSVAFECTNITNEKLYDNYRLQKPGRAFNVKFRLFLQKM